LFPPFFYVPIIEKSFGKRNGGFFSIFARFYELFSVCNFFTSFLRFVIKI